MKSLHLLLQVIILIILLDASSQTVSQSVFTYKPQRWKDVSLTERDRPTSVDQLLSLLQERNSTDYMQGILRIIDKGESIDTRRHVQEIINVETRPQTLGGITYKPISYYEEITCPENEEQLKTILETLNSREKIISILNNLGTPSPSSTDSSQCPTAHSLPDLSTALNSLGPHSFRQTFNKSCNTENGESLAQIQGSHNNTAEDRRYDLFCRQIVPNAFTNCFWTSFVNEYNSPLLYQCPTNYVIAGVVSTFDPILGDGGTFDRRFDLLCCNYQEFCTSSCSLSDFINQYDGEMYFSLPSRSAIIGAYSVHDNFHDITEIEDGNSFTANTLTVYNTVIDPEECLV